MMCRGVASVMLAMLVAHACAAVVAEDAAVATTPAAAAATPAAADEGRGHSFKKTMLNPMMLIPQLISLGFAPIVLANLKMMVMSALMINNMALNAAIFMTIRNMVFGPRPTVKYHNYGYRGHQQHRDDNHQHHHHVNEHHHNNNNNNNNNNNGYHHHVPPQQEQYAMQQQQEQYQPQPEQHQDRYPPQQEPYQMEQESYPPVHQESYPPVEQTQYPQQQTQQYPQQQTQYKQTSEIVQPVAYRNRRRTSFAQGS